MVIDLKKFTRRERLSHLGDGGQLWMTVPHQIEDVDIYYSADLNRLSEFSPLLVLHTFQCFRLSIFIKFIFTITLQSKSNALFISNKIFQLLFIWKVWH